MIKVDPIAILPNKTSTDQDWIVWYEAVNKEFGKKQANTLFLRAWNKRTEKDGFFISAKANTENLRDYMKKQGVTIDKSLADYPVSVLDGGFDFFESTFNMGKKALLVTAILAVIIILAVVYVIVKKPEVIVSAIRPGR